MASLIFAVLLASVLNSQPTRQKSSDDMGDRAAVTAVIRDTIARFSPGGDSAAFESIAKRESNFTPNAVGDKKVGLSVYNKQRDKLIAMGNPWAEDADRWGNSIGLFQFMPAYYARLWHPKADPHDLFDPRIATVVAGRLWNRALALGARNPLEVRLVWAFGTDGLQHKPGSPEYEKRLITESNRMIALGYPASYATRDASLFGLGGFGTSPTADQWDRLNIAPSDDPRPNTETHVGRGGSLLFPLALVGAGIGMLIWAKKK